MINRVSAHEKKERSSERSFHLRDDKSARELHGLQLA